MQKVDLQKPLLIQSVAFKDVFLHMDGKGITTSKDNGAGKVSCQKSISPTGAFQLHQQKDGTFTIESVMFPGVYLRMDGNSIHSFVGNGAGTVNCQFGVGNWERFKLNSLNNGSFTIESVAFPNVVLRMDGNNPSGKEKDFGKVNCQYGAGPYEKFYLVNYPEIGIAKDFFSKFHL